MKTNSVSLIIPCYNEEPNIKEGTLLKVAEYTKSDDRFGEVLIVDDGSTDKSRALIEKQFLPKYPKLRLIKNNHAGKAFAVITGIKESSHDYVFFSDFDLATPIEECEKLFAEVDKGNHVVIGSRSANREGAPLLRKTMALGFMISRNIIIGLRGITDTQCGFKIFDRRVALEIIDKLHVFKQEHVITTPSVTAGFDIEFLFIAKQIGCKIKEVPVTWHHVKTERVGFLRDAMETYRDILKIRFNDIVGGYDFSKKKYTIDLL